MIHFHRWRPVAVSHLYRHVIFSEGPGCPVTQVIRKCSHCDRVKDAEVVNGHWTMADLFTPATAAAP